MYLYNLTNAEAVISGGEPPDFAEVGPWVYGIGWRYGSQNWSPDNSVLAYDAYEYTQFCPSYRLGPGPVGTAAFGQPADDQPVMGVNLAYQRTLSQGGTAIAKDVFGDLPAGDRLFSTRSAREWLVGYEDPTLRKRFPDHAAAKALLRVPWVTGLLPNMSAPSPTPPVNDTGHPMRQHWHRNRTAVVDTGVANDSATLDHLKILHGEALASTCTDPAATSAANAGCHPAWVQPVPSSRAGLAAPPLVPGAVNGTAGYRFPFMRTQAPAGIDSCGRHNLSMWLGPLQRTVTLMPVQPNETDAHETRHIFEQYDHTVCPYQLDPEDAMDAEEILALEVPRPPYDMHSGGWVWNMSRPAGLPQFLSLPHFELALDPHGWADQVNISLLAGAPRVPTTGLELVIEPNTGQRVGGAVAIQTNYLSDLSDLRSPAPRTLMIPVGWLRWERNSTQADFDQIDRLIIQNSRRLLFNVGVGIAAIVFFWLALAEIVKERRERDEAVQSNLRTVVGRRSAHQMCCPLRLCGQLGLCGPNRSAIRSHLNAAGRGGTSTAQSGSPLRQALLSDGSRRNSMGLQVAESILGGVDQVIEYIDDGEEDSDSGDDNDGGRVEQRGLGPVVKLDVAVWYELVGRRRPVLGRCRCLLELMPWYLWWYLGLLPKTEPDPSHPIMWPGPIPSRVALTVSAAAAIVVFGQQVGRWWLNSPKERIFLLAPTAVDIITLAVFCTSACIAWIIPDDIAELGGSWPAITHAGLLVPLAIALANGQPFLEPALVDEIRVEFWLEPVVSRLATALSQYWVAALGLTVMLQLIAPFSRLVSAHGINSAEDGWLTAAIPGCSLVFCAAFTLWYPLQFEREIVRLLNRRIRQVRQPNNRRQPTGCRQELARPADSTTVLCSCRAGFGRRA